MCGRARSGSRTASVSRSRHHRHQRGPHLSQQPPQHVNRLRITLAQRDECRQRQLRLSQGDRSGLELEPAMPSQRCKRELLRPLRSSKIRDSPARAEGSGGPSPSRRLRRAWNRLRVCAARVNLPDAVPWLVAEGAGVAESTPRPCARSRINRRRMTTRGISSSSWNHASHSTSLGRTCRPCSSSFLTTARAAQSAGLDAQKAPLTSPFVKKFVTCSSGDSGLGLWVAVSQSRSRSMGAR